VDGKPYPIIEIAPLEGFYDYKNKYEPGSTIETCPACLSEEQTEKMQEYAVRAYEALRLESYGRIDFLMDEDGKMFCLEANTLPGMTPTSLLPQEAAVMGIGFAKLCETLIQVSKEKKFI
jgi:D-alanine-D-alanine ligase